MRHNRNILLGPIPQPASSDLAPLLDRGRAGRPPPLLAIPARLHPGQVHGHARELLGEVLRVAAGVARHVAGLLQLRQRDDRALTLLDDIGKSLDGGVDGAFEGRRDDQLDGGAVGESLGEILALLVAVGGEEGVAHVVVGDGEVVVALGVADQVDGGAHRVAVAVGTAGTPGLVDVPAEEDQSSGDGVVGRNDEGEDKES